MRARKSVIFLLLWGIWGCDGDAREAQKKIHDEHMSYIAQTIRQDRADHRRGIREAAERLAPGFVAEVEDDETRERQMRYALRVLQEPGRNAISEFAVSPMSFLAAVDSDGEVICRDGSADDDRMRGQNFAERFESVRVALEEGRPAYELAEFESAEEGGESSFSMLFVHPSKKDGEVVGAAVAGIPLWREAQRLTRQLTVDAGEQTDLIFWVYLYKGDQLFHFGTPEGVDEEMRSGVGTLASRQEGLSRSPGGYTGEVMVMGRWFAYGVLPIPSLGEDIGAVIWRSDPL